MPPSVPRSFGFGLAGACHGAFGFGGDFYDVVQLSDSSLLMVVADVMGKGLAASLFANSLRTLVRTVARPDGCPSQWLRDLNGLMFEQLSGADMFVTVQLVVADLRRRQLRIGNAGHCPLLVSDGLHRTKAIAPDGMPLGIQMDTEFEEECVPLDPFSSVLLYTDGLTEARDHQGQFFGQERLASWFDREVRANQTSDQLRENLLEELNHFQGGAHPTDDQTLLFLSDETPRAHPFPTTPVVDLALTVA